MSTSANAAAAKMPLPALATAAHEGLPRASLYVGDLHPETTEADLHEAFSGMGHVVSVHLCRCALTGKSLCYAYVNFYHHSDASRAMACLNYTNLKGKPMRIMWCQRDPLLRKCGVGNLFIKNLDPSVTAMCLLDLFCQFGTVISCKVADENGKSKGFGFVQFDSEESATAAHTAMHDTYFRGKKLFVSKFVKKTERSPTSENSNFTNLYVKIFEDMTEDALNEMFSKFGKVCNVVIMKDGKGKSRGFGFVNFQSAEEARKAVEVMNGAQMGSKILFVGRAQKKSERTGILKRECEEACKSHMEKLKASNLYVKNLSSSVDDNKLQELFCGFGRITSSRVTRHNDGTSKGFGFVCFSTPEEAKNALDTLNGAYFEGRSLYVAIAQSKEDREKQLKKSHAQFPELSLYTSNTGGTSSQYSPYYYGYHPHSPPFPLLHQPVFYQHYGTHMGLQHPPATKNYQKNYASNIPVRQTNQANMGNGRSWIYLEPPLTYSTSTVYTQELHNGKFAGQRTGHKLKGCIRGGPAESASKGDPSGSLSTAKSRLNTNVTGDVLQPLVDKLQPERAASITGLLLEMKNSEMINLRNSANSLAKQANNTVQGLKEGNARKSADGGVALPNSISCLSY